MASSRPFSILSLYLILCLSLRLPTLSLAALSLRELPIDNDFAYINLNARDAASSTIACGDSSTCDSAAPTTTTAAATSTSNTTPAAASTSSSTPAAASMSSIGLNGTTTASSLSSNPVSVKSSTAAPKSTVTGTTDVVTVHPTSHYTDGQTITGGMKSTSTVVVVQSGGGASSTPTGSAMKGGAGQVHVELGWAVGSVLVAMLVAGMGAGL